MPSGQLWTQEAVFSIVDTVNSENTNMSYNQIFVLRVILLEREKRQRPNGLTTGSPGPWVQIWPSDPKTHGSP